MQTGLHTAPAACVIDVFTTVFTGGRGGEISLLIRSWPLSVVCVLSPREDESTIHFGSFGYASKRVKGREVTLRVVVIDRSYIGMCSF